jgi:hypothetical protein
MPSRKRTRQIQAHFQQRAGERLGYQVPRGSQEDIVKQIQSGRARFVRRTSLTRTVWEVPIGEEVKTVVYDKRRKVIVTVW